MSATHHLYCVSLPSTSVTHVPWHPSALYASCVPDVMTWHCHLGHCSVQSIVDMAWKDAVEGMTIDLSSAPPKCTHCMLGKQTHFPVPKLWEGPKATKRLERVFVDLCGPMPCVSRTGRLYAMHVINDFFSYVWSLPLRSKGDASSVFQLQHKHVTTQTDLPLKCLITDNGKLISKSMHEWCQSLGIDHTVTAPYTSAQNGHAKHVHHMILGCHRRLRVAVGQTGLTHGEEKCALRECWRS